MLAATKVGTINNQGDFDGKLGLKLKSLLDIMTALNADLIVFSSILSVIITSQVFCYAISGVFGCSSAPIFVGRTINLFIWSIIKSFVVASGIIATTALYVIYNDWTEWSAKASLSILIASGLLLAVPFSMVYLHYEIYLKIKNQLIEKIQSSGG